MKGVNRPHGGVEIGVGKGNRMRYYIYYDAYRRPGQAVSEKELSENFNGDPDLFLKKVSETEGGREMGKGIGHVGIRFLENEEELKAYLEETGDEITGFYECEEGTRPYNF